MRNQKPAWNKLGRLAIVVVLCLDVYACGNRTTRDLSMSGAVQKFDERRAAIRAQNAKLDAEANGEAPFQNPIKPLPPRRELLQVRVPETIAVSDIVDGVVATSISGALVGTSAPDGRVSPSERTLSSQTRALGKRIEVSKRNQRERQATYDREKSQLDQLDMRHGKARDLLLQEFKLSYETKLQAIIADLATQYKAAQPATVLGLTENNEFGALALFGRNELARPDEYVSLQKSFLFVGNDVTTGVSLGRMDALAEEVGSRALSVNLVGLRLPTALKSLARSINMQIYLSPRVDANTSQVNLDISRADALDIFDILIDNYGLAMAYDRKMGVARFYTVEEFNSRVQNALAAAEVHNRRARNYRKISSFENDSAAIRQIYQAYFQHPDDAGRARSLTNDAIVEAEHSPLIGAAIVDLKTTALANERRLDALDLEQSQARQTQATTTQVARFALDDINQAIALLVADKATKTALLASVQAADMAKAESEAKIASASMTYKAPVAVAAKADPRAMTPRLSGPDADQLRGRIIRDANLKTTEPIYTEKFTIFNSEGANSCNAAESGDRTTQIKTELENYYGQLYPDGLIAAERLADISRQNKAEAEAESEEETGEEASLPEALEGEVASDLAPTEAPASSSPPEAAAPDTQTSFTNASFRRPTVTSVADTVIVTGFKHDVDLAASLIESLDKADKQVLVEVFMVNVVKDWKRQLQGRLENALRTPAKTDSSFSDLPTDVRSAYGDLVEVRDNGLFGVRGALNFANRAAAANSFTLNNFRLGLGWTIDFMESNSLGRKVSSPTILALNGCEAQIEKSETRYLPIISTSAPVVTPGGQTVPGEATTTYQERQAKLSLVVTPTINSLNDHVRLKVDFNDDFFVTDDANSDKVQSKINTEFIAAPGDVIVLAGLFTEDNSKTRNGLPGTTSVPLVSSLLGTSSDAQKTQEMVIFLAPEVITPKAGEMPINSAAYYETR